MIIIPMYEYDCWRDILKGICINTDNINIVHSTLIPSNIKFVQMLQIVVSPKLKKF
ncbi:hypothetical protein ACJMK2_039543, partial [Sinanodonta woodiana]